MMRTTATALALLSLVQMTVVRASPTGNHGAQRPLLGSEEGFWTPSEDVGGVLTRIELNGRKDMRRFLDFAQTTNLDVWQLTPTHADIFTPTPTASPLQNPDLLANYTTLSSHPITAPPPAGPALAASAFNVRNFTNTTFHDVYHPLADVDAFAFALAEQYPERAHILSLGHSGEGREMYALRVSSGPLPAASTEDHDDFLEDGHCVISAGNGKRRRGKKGRGRKAKPKPHGPGDSAKPGVVIFGPQHAREWIGTATTLYIAHALLANETEAGSLASLLATHDFYIVSSPNPDGYAYTWEKDRFWYKNRQTIGPYEKCIGLDMNRNWGYKWKKTARAGLKDAVPAPIDPCSHWYPGRRAFEAPETNNLANFVESLPGLVAFIDLRSYGQMVSSPFSHSCKKVPKDAEDQLELASGAAHAAQKTHGTWFTMGQLCHQLYRAGGNVVDYMYAKAGIKYSYAIHLRDTGTFGFSLPPQWIRPVGEETAEMVRYLTKFIHHKGY